VISVVYDIFFCATPDKEIGLPHGRLTPERPVRPASRERGNPCRALSAWMPAVCGFAIGRRRRVFAVRRARLCSFVRDRGCADRR